MYIPHFDWVQFTINAVLGIDWSHKHAAPKAIIAPSEHPLGDKMYCTRNLLKPIPMCLRR